MSFNFFMTCEPMSATSGHCLKIKTDASTMKSVVRMRTLQINNLLKLLKTKIKNNQNLVGLRKFTKKKV